MKRALSAAIAALLVSGVPAGAQDGPNAAYAALRTKIITQLQTAATRWGVSPTFRIEEQGNKLEALDSGRIDVPLAAVRNVLRDMSDANSDYVVAWLMAHEVWHVVQIRDGWHRVTASNGDKRLRECEADVMSAYAVLDARLATGVSLANEQSTQQLSAAIGQVIEVAERLEAGSFGNGDHPDANQRRAAIRAGSARALAERINSLSIDPQRGLLKDRLAKIHDIRSDEDPGDWASRLCRSILHSGDAADNLAVGTEQINWNKSGEPPVVDFRIPYRNTGDRPIHVTMQVRSVSVPRASPNDRGKWIVADLKSYNFDLAPGATYDVAGRLAWYATDDVYPKLVFPNRSDSYFDVVRLGPSSGGSVPSSLMDLGPEAIQLKASLALLYNDARYRFSHVRTNCETFSSFRSCDITIPVVGTTSTNVTIDQDGSASIDLKIYEGASEADALAAYRRFYRWLRAIYPAIAFEERTRDGRDQVKMRPAPTADLMLYKRQKTSGGFEVVATIDALLF
jgi:hypothetical protein